MTSHYAILNKEPVCGAISNIIAVSETEVSCKQCAYILARKWQRHITVNQFPYLETKALREANDAKKQQFELFPKEKSKTEVGRFRLRN